MDNNKHLTILKNLEYLIVFSFNKKILTFVIMQFCNNNTNISNHLLSHVLFQRFTSHCFYAKVLQPLPCTYSHLCWKHYFTFFRLYILFALYINFNIILNMLYTELEWSLMCSSICRKILDLLFLTWHYWYQQKYSV